MKTCRDCGFEGADKEFVSGKNWCKNCYRAYQREWLKNRPAEKKQHAYALAQKRLIVLKKKIYKYLLNHPCVDCGMNHPAALDFDHKDDVNKQFNISKSQGRSWETTLAEIGKCEVRCANCHIKRTGKRVGFAKYWFSQE